MSVRKRQYGEASARGGAVSASATLPDNHTMHIVFFSVSPQKIFIRKKKIDALQLSRELSLDSYTGVGKIVWGSERVELKAQCTTV